MPSFSSSSERPAIEEEDEDDEEEDEALNSSLTFREVWEQRWVGIIGLENNPTSKQTIHRSRSLMLRFSGDQPQNIEEFAKQS